MADAKNYTISIKKLGDKFDSPKDCVDTLYDEFRLEARVSARKVCVHIYSERQKDKLKKFMRKYGASKEYIDEVIGSEEYRLNKKKTTSVKEEMTKNNIYNMRTKKRPSLNEGYFDQSANGVLNVGVDELFSMIPSRLRNGKKVIVFLHEDMLNEFKQKFARAPYEFGTCTWEEISQYGVDKLLLDNLQKSTFDVFVVGFTDENALSGFQLDQQLSRKYATFAVDFENEIDDQEQDDMNESMSYRRKKALHEARMHNVRRPSLNESWLDEEDEEDEEIKDRIPDEDNEESDDPNMQFVDELVEKYDIEDQPSIEDFEDMILEIKEYVDDLDPDDFDGKLFCDMVGYLCRDKFGVFISEDPEFESIKYLFKGSLKESQEIRASRRNAINEAKEDKPAKAPKSEFAGKSIDGKKLRDYKLIELGDLLKEKKDALKEAKAAVRKEKDEKKAAKLQKEVDKILAEIEMIKGEIKFRKANKMNESSVREQFNKYSKIFEEEDISEDEDKDEDKSDDEGSEDKPEDQSDEKPEEKEDDSKDSDNDSDEEVPMTAVLITVDKDDVDKAKQQMIDAGVEEYDIDVVEGDSDSDDTQIKVDANSIMALKDWLKEKGVDLEEKLGGEIVAPEDNGEDDSDDKEKSDDGSVDAEQDLSDMSFDDIFGENSSSDEEKK